MAISSNRAQTSTGGPSQTSRPNQPESVSRLPRAHLGARCTLGDPARTLTQTRIDSIPTQAQQGGAYRMRTALSPILREIFSLTASQIPAVTEALLCRH